MLEMFLMNWLKKQYLKYRYKKQHLNNQIRPSPVDNRDYKYQRTGSTSTNDIDLRPGQSPVRSQGSINCCFSFAGAGLLENLMYKKTRVPYVVSPSYNYYVTRMYEEVYPSNVGCYIRSYIKSLYKKGFCFEREMPFKQKASYKPTDKAENTAELFKRLFLTRTEYQKVPPSLYLNCLKKKQPILLGLVINSSWFKVKKDGVIDDESQDMGGHAVLLVGRKTIGNKKYAIIKNSWGCYDKETKVLTDKGFKYFEELNGFEKFATLNENHELEYQEATKYHKYKFEGNMHHYKSSKIDCLVTPNHRILYRTLQKKWMIEESKKIKNKRLYFKRGCEWKGYEDDYFYLPSVKIKRNIFREDDSGELKINIDDWLRFIGYYIAEGSCAKVKQHKNGFQYKVHIAQTKKWSKEIISNNLKNLPFNFCETEQGFSCSNKQLYDYVVKLGKCDKKYIPEELLSLKKERLKILYNSLMICDGSEKECINGSRKVTYYTTSKKLKDQFVELCLKLNYATNIYIDDRRGTKNTQGHNYNYVCYQIRINGTQSRGVDTIVDDKDLVYYNDYVYCVTVPNSTLFVQRNGKSFWSGNSRWGDNGYCYVPWSHLTKNSFDAWTIDYN